MDLTLDGFGQLRSKLDRLEAKTGKKVVRRALRAGAKIILAETQERAPVLTGATKASLRVRAAKARRASKTFGVGVSTSEGWFIGDQFYAAFLEFGTSRAAAQPFMRPAFDAKKHEALAAVTAEIRRGVEAEARAT